LELKEVQTKMSWIINKSRNWLGYENVSTPTTVTTPEETQKFIRKLQAELGQLNYKLNKIISEIPLEKNRELLKLKLIERDRLKQQIVQLQSRLQNIGGTQEVVSNAVANVQTARILQSATDTIEKSVKEAEKIDLDSIVDKYQDNAVLTQDFSTRLSQPWLTQTIDEDKLDDELDQLMNENDELEKWLNTPVEISTSKSNDNSNNIKTFTTNPMV
jgi:hypothetical protein